MPKKRKSVWSNHKKLTRAENIHTVKCDSVQNEKITKYWATNIKCMISSNPIYSQQTSSTNGNLTTEDLSLAHHSGLLINMILLIKKKNQHFPWSLRCLFFKTANVVNSCPFLSNHSLFSDGSSWLALHNLWCASHWKKKLAVRSKLVLKGQISATSIPFGVTFNFFFSSVNKSFLVYRWTEIKQHENLFQISTDILYYFAATSETRNRWKCWFLLLLENTESYSLSLCQIEIIDSILSN